MQKQLLPVINESDGSLEDFYERLKTVTLTERCKELLEQGKAQVLINYELVKLDTNCEVKRWKWS